MFTLKQNLNPLTGEIVVPGSIDISHFSLILASLAKGKTKIKGLLESSDILNLMKILKNLGVSIEKTDDFWVVDGNGYNGIIEPNDVIDIKDSKESLYSLVGLLSPYNFKLFFTGSQKNREIELLDLLSPLTDVGVKFSTRKTANLPMLMIGDSKILPINVEIDKISPTLKAALLLTSLNTAGENTIIEYQKSKDHLEILLKFLGLELRERDLENKKWFSSEISLSKEIKIRGQQNFLAKDINIPGDISYSSYLTALALSIEGSDITLKNIGANPLRDAFFRTLIDMGADINFIEQKVICGERVADVRIKYSKLRDTVIPAKRLYMMEYEYPILILLSALHKIDVKIQGIDYIKQRENDNFILLEKLLNNLDISYVVDRDTISIKGGIDKTKTVTLPEGAESKILMTHIIAGLFCDSGIKVSKDQKDIVIKDYPSFFDTLLSISKNE